MVLAKVGAAVGVAEVAVAETDTDGMIQRNLLDLVKKGVIKTGIAIIDAHLAYAEKTGRVSPEERAKDLIEAAKFYLRLCSPDGKATRPIAYLDKYLRGDGDKHPVLLHEMLTEDAGVRATVQAQIQGFLAQHELFAKTGIDTSPSARFTHAARVGQSDHPESYRIRATGKQTRPLRVDVSQPHYQNNDWQNAVGGFNLEWKLVNVRNDKTAVFAQLWGSNRYRWHENLNRVSQRVHKAAEKLKEFGAAEFDMVMLPCVIVIPTGEIRTVNSL